MLFDQISTDIMSAMKAHDKVRTQALRNVKKYFIEATVNSPTKPQ